jgi:hypothetical protein
MMRLMSKLTMLPCVLCFAIGCVAQQQIEKTPEFSRVEEIQLVVTQSERVFEQYNQAVKMEGQLPSSKNNASMIEKDQAVYDMGREVVAGLKVNPEVFHGVGGLLLLSSLDDASRNAALCSGTAYGDSMNAVMTKSDFDSAKDWIQVGLTCVNVSASLYTVSESVHALLFRDMQAQQALNQRGEEAVNECTSLLKKCASKK